MPSEPTKTVKSIQSILDDGVSFHLRKSAILEFKVGGKAQGWKEDARFREDSRLERRHKYGEKTLTDTRTERSLKDGDEDSYGWREDSRLERRLKVREDTIGLERFNCRMERRLKVGEKTQGWREDSMLERRLMFGE